MNNVLSSPEIAISVFGGLNSELSASDLPQGLSPDCKDMAFLPGTCFTRPSLRRFITVSDNAQILYAKTYVQNTGQTISLLLDSLGRIWANGTQIGSTTPGNRVFSTTLDGREYLAISDGLHGADVPLQYDGTNLDRVSQDGPGAPPTVENYGAPVLAGPFTLTRSGGVVTGTTSAVNGLQVGWRVSVTGFSPGTFGGGIASIVIDNSVDSGIALVTTQSPHGLTPGDPITLTDIPDTVVGGGATNSTGAGDVITVVTANPHGLSIGDLVVIANLGDGPPHLGDGVWTVTAVPNSTTFSYSIPGVNLSGTVGSGGSVANRWVGSADNTYTVVQCPSPTTFQISTNAANGTWDGGTVSFSWNGTFYVQSASLSEFTYQQVGPDDTNSDQGQITATGQISPGIHQVCVSFLTRTGYLTRPSPPVSITANGGQYLQISDLPIGPPNVVARVLIFTGANGGRFFYLPLAPKENGQIIGSSTQINDNTTTSVILDFSDDALLAAAGVDIPGNNLFKQVKLGAVLGFFSYGSRLFAWGERNKIQSFLNMGFEGGYTADAPNVPLGWTVDGQGQLVGGRYGQAWSTGTSTISQAAYQDQYGQPILQPNTQYTFRCSGDAVAEFYSAAHGVLATATVAGNGEAQFTAKTPAVIPDDCVLRVRSGDGSVIDELEVYYTDNPYVRGVRASYVNNFEAFDGVTGLLGPNDPNEVRTLFERKDVLLMLTAGPDGALYETYNTPSGEPATWDIRHIASKCGAVSVWGDAKFEDWQVWASDTGLRIYDGGIVEKISQEVQPWWDSFNLAAKQFVVVANDPYERRTFVLAPTASATIPNSTYVMDYRELNTAAAYQSSGPLRIGMGGKMFTTDLTRKWSPWGVTANYCGLMQVGGGAEMVFCGGSGTTVTDSTYGSAYRLDGFDGNDDDYGYFSSYYTTYYSPSQDESQQFGLSTHRKLFVYLTFYVSGVGNVSFVPLVDRSGYEYPASPSLKLQASPNYDYEVPINVAGERVAFRFQGAGAFVLNNVVIAMKTHPYSPIRGRI